MRRKLLSVIQSDDVTDGSGGKRDSTSKSVQVDCGTVTKVLFSRKWQRLFLYIIVLFGFVSILGLATIANLGWWLFIGSSNYSDNDYGPRFF